MKPVFFRCCGCLAMCQQLVWAALGVAEAEERCPRCGKWSKFVPVDRAGRPLLAFGEKERAA